MDFFCEKNDHFKRDCAKYKLSAIPKAAAPPSASNSAIAIASLTRNLQNSKIYQNSPPALNSHKNTTTKSRSKKP